SRSRSGTEVGRLGGGGCPVRLIGSRGGVVAGGRSAARVTAAVSVGRGGVDGAGTRPCPAPTVTTGRRRNRERQDPNHPHHDHSHQADGLRCSSLGESPW